MFCPKCGTENPDGAQFCASCGNSAGAAIIERDAAPAVSAPGTTQVVNVQMQGVVQKNGLGTAGFVLALIGVFTSWVPALGWIVWLLGAILSVVGIFRVPRGLAIAGTVLSFIDLILLLAVVSACSAVSVGAASLMG
ncbi:zinc ribbon domain-containing protein [Adlercreutzia mucosicola]|uniref:zinc ribbon domain-containing protein n=1 Tax=Adlercreutzia mucosicola TaxID=580026 RepID=UPI00146CC696|nr:zinc ribbon domain-containing protein [Adlercreutzia mucosicola]MCR2035407.1 zinc ribbon domain-containing protein [Adlercreutzia mucosicola]